MPDAGAPDTLSRPPLVRMLGPVQVRTAAGELVEPSGARSKALLVALALAAPATVGVPALVDDIWGDDAPRGAKAALQALVSRVRAAAGDGVVESTPSGYRLGSDGSDLARAERAVVETAAALDRDDAETAAALASGALELWRGEAGAEFDDELGRALRERAAAAEHALAVTAAEAALRLGRPAVTAARRAASGAPFDDRAHLLLMRALDEQGRPTEALAVFAEFRERVQDAFGSSPSLPLQELNLDLLQREATSLAATALALTAASTPVVVRGVRAAPNELLGRDHDITALEALLERSRVTTVLGAGGLGKTRVAQELAARATRRTLPGGSRRFDAVYVVELAGVRAGDDLVFALGSALGIREAATSSRLADHLVRADLRTRILNRLGEGRTLLVLDNCEHIVDAAAEWCSELTSELPELVVLTTSRTPLAIAAERVYPLPPLGRPAGSDDPHDLLDDPAVRLFVDRATAARPGALLPLETVARLCERLDGLPLAIELAAARIRSLGVDEVERRLSNRFVLLSGGDRSAPERHRTLLAVIEWSWNLLGTAEQRALVRCSEFADGFTLDGAASVLGGEADAVADLLDTLVAQSLLVVAEGRSGVRFRMLETVREFGRDRLRAAGESGEVQEALFVWADAFAAHHIARSDGAEQVAAFAAIAADEENLIDVLRRAIDAARPDVVVAVYALLAHYWALRSAHGEVMAFGRAVFGAVTAYRPEDDGDDEKTAQLAVGLVFTVAHMMIVDLRFAVRPLSRLRALAAVWTASDPRLATMVDVVLSARTERSLHAAVQRAIDSPDPRSALLGNLVGSIAAENEGRRDDAIALARAAVRMADALGDTWGTAMGGQMLGALYSQAGEPRLALEWAGGSREGLVALGADGDLRQLEWVIATNQIAVGDLDEARAVFERLTVSSGEVDDGIEVSSIGLAGLAEVYRAAGQVAEARAVYQRAADTFSAPRMRSSPWYRMVLSATLAALVLDGTGTAGERLRLARRLRARTLASLRGPSRGYTDRPVLGSSIVGLAVWAAECAPSIPVAVPLELLALAEAMASRQDTPALHLPPLFERFARAVHPETVAAARAAAAALPHDDQPERVAALLRTPGPWSWGWTG
ncbi:BTAD domain-containing putative transcriptional regulator [Herbiconiux moechotypicola]|uniref:BTAD domain-containing putative transcriptional regulator n=1 Tax=Herbiconiux moechotypicola TaxID=637393 RepID=A0ABN3DVV9_9MICO